MLAYMYLIVREASKFGGNGWLTYDSVFRRNQTGFSSPWNSLDASLHQVYIANQPSKIVPPCKHCHEVDHQEADCAVASVLPQSRCQLAEPGAQAGDRPPPPGKGKRPLSLNRQRPICYSWNAGNCKFPGKCAMGPI